MRTALLLLLLMSGVLAWGCSPGIIYTSITEPLVIDMNSTPRGARLVTLDTKQLKEPVTRFNLSAEWDSRAIGDAARQGGLSRIYYADIHTFSLLGGIWKQRTVRVWGD